MGMFSFLCEVDACLMETSLPDATEIKLLIGRMNVVDNLTIDHTIEGPRAEGIVLRDGDELVLDAARSQVLTATSLTTTAASRLVLLPILAGSNRSDLIFPQLVVSRSALSGAVVFVQFPEDFQPVIRQNLVVDLIVAAKHNSVQTSFLKLEYTFLGGTSGSLMPVAAFKFETAPMAVSSSSIVNTLKMTIEFVDGSTTTTTTTTTTTKAKPIANVTTSAMQPTPTTMGNSWDARTTMVTTTRKVMLTTMLTAETAMSTERTTTMVIKPTSDDETTSGSLDPTIVAAVGSLDPTVAAAIGGAVGAVVICCIAVVIAVIVIRRAKEKRRDLDQPQGQPEAQPQAQVQEQEQANKNKPIGTEYAAFGEIGNNNNNEYDVVHDRTNYEKFNTLQDDI
jgi:hypothetical protein